MNKTQADKNCYKLLISSKLVTAETLDGLIKREAGSKDSLARAVINSKLVSEDKLLELFAKHTSSAVVSLRSVQVDKTLLAKIPVKFVWYYKIFPVKLIGKKLTLAVSRILDVNTLDEVRFGLGFEIETVFAPENEIEDMLKAHYGLGADTLDKILTQSPSSEQPQAVSNAEKVQDIEELAEKASVIQLANQILLEAYKKRASDIHIEPDKGKVRLRYRIDGILQEAHVPPEMDRFLVPILSRIKIMANLNIVEKRLPQDGKARVKTASETFDMRVSSIPTPHGESMVIRLLPNRQDFSLDQLGFEEDQLKTLKELLARPNGIIFVTGPTGSGKSTTLYGALKTVDTVHRKVITIEDPVEYEMSRITQIQVAPDIGLTFAQGLRSILRHDPDILMVGEVRDLETADIAIRASLTGHLMLSTLHTNDAASGVTRLLDIGVEGYLISSSVLAFMAQRLVRVICPGCREELKQIEPAMKQLIAYESELLADDIKIYHGRGCRECNSTGYLGRAAVHEILVVDEEIRRLIFNRAGAAAIKQAARNHGMRTLRQDGWLKVLKGITTPEEVLQITPADESMAKGESLFAAEAAPKTAAQEISQLPELPSEAKEDANAVRDRRKYLRVDVHIAILFRTVEMEQGHRGEPKWSGEGQAANLSAGGVAFVTPVQLFLEDLLDLKIQLQDRSGPIECIGKVLRIQPVPGTAGAGVQYEVAVLFLAIHSTDRLKIEHYCQSHKDHETV